VKIFNPPPPLKDFTPIEFLVLSRRTFFCLHFENFPIGNFLNNVVQNKHANKEFNMNKIVSIAAIVALVISFSFARDIDMGVRAAINLCGASTTGGADAEEDIGVGIGFGGGLVTIIPIGDIFAVRTGAELYYREIFNEEITMGSAKTKVRATEFTLSIPALFEYSSVFGTNVWIGAGAQLDIPFAPELHYEVSGTGSMDGKESVKFKDRSSVDFGIIIGGGWNFTSNIMLDIRGTIKGLSLTELTSDKDDERSLYQASVGLSYLF
jgi:hypothetical protein